MATPTLGNTPTTIDDAESLTGWTITSGALDTELKREGSNAVFGVLRTDLATAFYDIVVDSGAAQDMTGRHVRIWIWFNSVGLLDTEANSGMEFFMDDSTNRAFWVAFGSDTYAGGWYNFVLDCDSTPDSGSFDKTIVEQWGFRFNRTAAPRNVDNTWLDYLRHGDGYFATGGTSGDEIDLTGIAAVDLTNGYGILEVIEGIYFGYGEIVLGDGATTTWFEMLSEVLVFTDKPVAVGLYGLIGVGSGLRVVIADSVLRAAGTTDAIRFALDMSDSGVVSCSITDTFITRAASPTFKSGQTITGNTFADCLTITHGGANFDGSAVSGYEGASNSSALIYNVNADPDGEMDNMVFAKGTAATHAIEFGTTSPLTMTLRGCDFQGYNASDANDDSTFHILRTTDTVTINLADVTGNTSFRTEGATVVILNTVTVQVTVRDANTLDPIENSRVLMETASGGPLPFQDSVTITRSGGTATVTHTAHGLITGDKVKIKGADQNEYNVGVQTIIETGVNTYTYSVSGTPDTPATGTITSTYVIFDELTNASGVVSISFNYPGSDQPITGRARKSTSSTFYKTAPIVGTIINSGLSTAAFQVADE